MTPNQQLIYNKCDNELSLGTAKLSDEYYYDSIPQCIIDAVYSIGVRYAGTKNAVKNYCQNKKVTRISNPLGNQSDAHTVNDLLSNMQPYVAEDYGASSLFVNKCKTSTKNGILKAEAVYKFATTLKNNGIQTLSEIRRADYDKISKIENEIKTIPGQRSGISFSYFLMLSGDDNHMKIDRWLLRFVGAALGINNYNNVKQAYSDLLVVCNELKKIYPNLTPRLLDHTIWSYMK